MAAVVVDIGADTSAFTREVNRLPEAVNRATAGMNKATGGAKGGGSFGALGRASLQFQDIAVQAQMGAKWTTIMAQQGSQLLSVFGPTGMIAGGLVAIGGAFVTMADNAMKAFEDAKNSAADFNNELDKVLAVGGFSDVGDSVTEVGKRIRDVNSQMSDLVGTSQALFGMGDKLKVVWSDVKSALGLGPSIEDQQGALNERKAELLQREAEATQRLMQLSGQQAELAEMKAKGQTKAAEQMERQIKLGQELARIEGMSLTRGQKGQLINDANRRFVAAGTPPPDGNILSRLSGAFSTFAGPMMAEVKAQLTDQAGTLKGRASTFAKGAFGGIRGDMDTSFGRGSSINPFTARAGSQIQEMTRQSNLMLKQAAKLDTSNALLTDIRAAVKSFNLVPTYK
jgi:hypothetical protein